MLRSTPVAFCVAHVKCDRRRGDRRAHVGSRARDDRGARREGRDDGRRRRGRRRGGWRGGIGRGRCHSGSSRAEWSSVVVDVVGSTCWCSVVLLAFVLSSSSPESSSTTITIASTATSAPIAIAMRQASWAHPAARRPARRRDRTRPGSSAPFVIARSWHRGAGTRRASTNGSRRRAGAQQRTERLTANAAERAASEPLARSERPRAGYPRRRSERRASVPVAVSARSERPRRRYPGRSERRMIRE